MLSISTAAIQRYKNSDRRIRVKIVLNGETDIDGNYIQKLTFTERSAATNQLSMGEACSAQVTLSMYKPPDIGFSLVGAYFDVWVGVVLTDCRLGRFKVDKVTTNASTAVDTSAITYTITAYDAMYEMSGNKYTPSISFPANINDVVNEIANKNGLSADVITSNITIDKVYDVSEKDMLGYIAGLLGKNVRVDRYGRIVFYWYSKPGTDGYEIDTDQQFMNGFVRTSAEDYTINSITSGTTDNVIVAGDGRGIQFSNPYMTQDILNTIWDNVRYSTYTPATLKYRCCPAIEIGDIVTVKDIRGNEYDLYVTAQTINIAGGMDAEITSIGGGDTVSMMNKSPTEKKLEQLANSLTESFKNSFKTITGAENGYFNIDVDENGIPVGWSIKDTPTITPTTHIWRMTMGGFAFSLNGGASFSNFALDLNGNISANAITTGTMSAQRIAVEGGTLDDYFKVGTDDDGQIYVQIGSSDSPIVLKEVNDRIGFYDADGNVLAFFSNNAFDIVNLQRFKIGNFAFVPRTNGNLSFMKVV